MKRTLLVTLSMGVGWILGVTVMMILMPVSGGSAFSLTFLEAMGFTLFYGFPGFMLFLVAIILAIKEPKEDDLFKDIWYRDF